MPKATARAGFRSDIQALRAIAVSVVAVGHFFPTRLPGGFVGVDVFFVVSGFLITSHLLRELQGTGRLRLGRFYARRARRLLPAAYLVVLVSLVGALILLPVSRWRDTAVEVFAASAYFENWLLAAKAADFSAGGASATVVRHYWSLSVEEQFYLLWPLLLLVGFALARKAAWRPRAVLAGLLIAIGGVSFWAAVQITAEDMTTAYFVTHTRVWEFAVGALLAVGAPLLGRLLERQNLMRGVLQWAGVILILAAVLAFDTETAFPGPWAAVPVLGTALVIAAGPAAPRFTPMRAAVWRPVQFLGDISYSLYLWHWPLFVLAPFAVGRSLGIAERLTVLALAVVLAALTKRFIEDPARTRLLISLPTPKFFVALGASVAVIGLISLPVVEIGQARVDRDRAELAVRADSACFGAGALGSAGADAASAVCDDPFAATDLLVVGASESPWYTPAGCDDGRHRKPPLRCDFSDGDEASKNVWLVGNAGVKNWKPAVLSLAEQEGWRLTLSPKGGCSVVETPQDRARKGLKNSGNCERWMQRMSEAVIQDQPDLILISQASFAGGADESGGSGDSANGRAQPSEEYTESVAQLARVLSASGAQLVVLRDVPETLGNSTPECLELHMSTPLSCANPRSEALPDDVFATAFESLGRENVSILDLSDSFCDDELCYALIGGLPVHFDDKHLARSYSQSLAPRLHEQLMPLLTLQLH